MPVSHTGSFSPSPPPTPPSPHSLRLGLLSNSTETGGVDGWLPPGLPQSTFGKCNSFGNREEAAEVQRTQGGVTEEGGGLAVVWGYKRRATAPSV